MGMGENYLVTKDMHHWGAALHGEVYSKKQRIRDLVGARTYGKNLVTPGKVLVMSLKITIAANSTRNTNAA